MRPDRLCFCFRRFLALLATFSLFVYIVLCPASSPIYKWMVTAGCARQSQPYPPTALRGVVGRNCWIPLADGKKLHGLAFLKPGARTITVIHHGIGGNVLTFAPFAELALAAGSSALLYDYEGYGRSDGELEFNNMCRDGAAACRFASNALKFPPQRIVQMGVSLGTGVASNVAKLNKCAGVVLVSPYADFISVAKQDSFVLGMYPELFFPFRNLECVSFLSGPHPPVLMFAGTADCVIRIEHTDILAMHSIHPLEYVRYLGAAHCGIFGVHTAQTLKAMTTFIGRLNQDRGAPAQVCTNRHARLST